MAVCGGGRTNVPIFQYRGLCTIPYCLPPQGIFTFGKKIIFQISKMSIGTYPNVFLNSV
jgi:hypothetical protein